MQLNGFTQKVKIIAIGSPPLSLTKYLSFPIICLLHFHCPPHVKLFHVFFLLLSFSFTDQNLPFSKIFPFSSLYQSNFFHHQSEMSPVVPRYVRNSNELPCLSISFSGRSWAISHCKMNEKTNIFSTAFLLKAYLLNVEN